MGFKDGTNNITADERDALRRHVWVGSEAPAWLRGGTYMVTRRIRMLIEVWDRASLGEQWRRADPAPRLLVLFAVPPGVRGGSDYVGRALLDMA